ncbi:hypothetical protein H181DRAFT_03466 [Streptomyces sp. WMMB 714]|uniref:hypothetical protein n=1 Tax=Streptomyces sp. WMMB 714 TaxID=1286822 RepID=UPI0005F7BE74|nr:hypothetical protein [Streptomyces sp. WMMB 714]SCK40033.1 hypothetical protein H181DRAFT_03466 [Streptomyces sp. WMMB 714]
MTTARRNMRGGLAGLVGLTAVSAVCVTAALTQGSEQTIAVCEGRAQPEDLYVLSAPGLIAAVLAVALYFVLRRRASAGSGTAEAPGRAGLVTALLAGVALLGGALAVWGDYHRTVMADLAAQPNTLVTCRMA